MIVSERTERWKYDIFFTSATDDASRLWKG